MLSYQHHFHAGNLADVHKHALLAWMLSYLTQKDKPLIYIETHAGRGIYDLSAPAARKTGEAARGIGRLHAAFAPTHPYAQVLDKLRGAQGDQAYPGSPLIAAHLLRPGDAIHLAELHPGEHAALKTALSPYRAKLYAQDGFELAHGLVPPTPRRGIMLIDPSYEVKSDYQDIPRHLAKINRAWNVGVLVLWYPVLSNGAQRPLRRGLAAAHPSGFGHEVHFAPARPGHGMQGSGLFVINPPFGLHTAAAEITGIFERLHDPRSEEDAGPDLC
ncbi:MAG: 23S rRNA (adenine(2030)-N(6))-methyltransferase RlmJ [Pseudomonadota bacterium]